MTLCLKREKEVRHKCEHALVLLSIYSHSHSLTRHPILGIDAPGV